MKKRFLRINLAQGFLGNVQINRVSYGNNMKTINVGIHALMMRYALRARRSLRLRGTANRLSQPAMSCGKRTGDGILGQTRFTSIYAKAIPRAAVSGACRLSVGLN